MRGTGVRLAQDGYAVYGIDYEGHGKSEGLQGQAMANAQWPIDRGRQKLGRCDGQVYETFQTASESATLDLLSVLACRCLDWMPS